METLLIVDDDVGFRQLLSTILEEEGYRVDTAASAADARRMGTGKQYHLVLSDLRLPDGDGLDVLRWFAEHSPETPFIMITAYGTVASAVEAMKLGAMDYLGKPLESPEELRLMVRRTLDQKRAQQERDFFREQEQNRFDCDRLIASDPAMIRVLDLARKVAPTPCSLP
jgi:DNA-binding NtrC family response regulator